MWRRALGHMEQLRPKSLERSKKHWETGSGNGSRRKRSSPSVFEIIKRIWDPQRWGYVINNFVLRCLYDHARSAQQATRLAGSSVVKSLQSLAWHGCPHPHTVQAYSKPRRKDLPTGALGNVLGTWEAKRSSGDQRYESARCLVELEGCFQLGSIELGPFTSLPLIYQSFTAYQCVSLISDSFHWRLWFTLECSSILSWHQTCQHLFSGCFPFGIEPKKACGYGSKYVKILNPKKDALIMFTFGLKMLKTDSCGSNKIKSQVSTKKHWPTYIYII